MDNKKYEDRDKNNELSIYELWMKLLDFLDFIIRYKFVILCAGIVFFCVGYLVPYLTKPRYKASITFALEQGNSGLGGFNGLVSQFGLGMGNFGNDGLGGDNLLTLMKSRRIIEEVLLSTIHIGNDSILLINQFVETNSKVKGRWVKLGIYPIDPMKCCSPSQDSAIGRVVKFVTEKSLAVAKVDKKQSFVTVTYEGHDEVFTGAFVELLTAKSTDFYVQTKMANAHANISKLEQRVDSVSAEMQAAMVGFASAQDQNSFTVQSVAKVPSVQKQMKVTMLTTLYGELVKNLELSKTMSAREEPLITIIDRPHYPLRVRESKLKSAAIGGVLGVFLTLLFLGGRAFLSDLNKQAAALKPKA
jgi:hypothetical protein